MRLLLDTHALLWFHLGSPKLSSIARAAIEDLSHDKLVSPASYWEIAIKLKNHKYLLNGPYEAFIQEAIVDNNFEILPIEPKHTSALIALPLHHKDPFDRLLIAQAIVEGIPIIGADAKFDSYPVSRVW